MPQPSALLRLKRLLTESSGTIVSGILRTVTETVLIGLAAALAAVAIGMPIDRGYNG